MLLHDPVAKVKASASYGTHLQAHDRTAGTPDERQVTAAYSKTRCGVGLLLVFGQNDFSHRRIVIMRQNEIFDVAHMCSICNFNLTISISMMAYMRHIHY